MKRSRSVALEDNTKQTTVKKDSKQQNARLASVDKEEHELFEPGTLVDDDLSLVLKKSKGKGSGGRGLGLESIPSYDFEMRHTIGGHLLGVISFRIGEHSHPYIQKTGHLGYTVRPAYRGHKYAARSVKLLFPLATKHKLDMLSIVVNSDNVASLRVCEYLGASCVEEYNATWLNKPVLRRRYHLQVMPEERKENTYYLVEIVKE